MPAAEAGTRSSSVNSETHFKCENCGMVFEKNCSDEVAQNENEQNFGKVIAATPHAVVCTPCYEEFMEWYKQNSINQ